MLEVPSHASHAGGSPSNCPVLLLKPTCQLCFTFVGVPISLMASSFWSLFEFFLGFENHFFMVLSRGLF